MKIYNVLLAACVGLAAVSIATAAEAPASFKVGEFTFARPASWEWVESTSPMRKAEMKVAGTGHESADVIFFYFGAGGGGGVQANVDRWLGQFKEPHDQLKSKTETATVAGRKVSFVEAHGTYLSGLPGGPKTPQPNSMLLGAILESEEGNVFVRMTGPARLVTEAQPKFRKMIESLQIGK